MSDLLAAIESQVEALLSAPTYSLAPTEHHARLLSVLRDQLTYTSECNPQLRSYFAAWPIDYQAAESIAELPYLPVGTFKANPPLTLGDRRQIVRTLTSSATTGQTPSRVALDSETSKRMVRGVTSVFRDFIGSKRRPYLVIDAPETMSNHAELSARGAAIHGLRPFATDTVCCLLSDDSGNLTIDLDRLFEFAHQYRDVEVLAYGFTYILWQKLVVPLAARNITLDLAHIRVLHSGGWKRLQDQAVTRAIFAAGVAATFGCAEARVVDFYGMVENLGVVYPDCEYGFKHVPAFAEVLVRDPLTLRPVDAGEQGLVQVCSALPTSFPGFLVLTDDIAEVISYDGCACGRRGLCFRFVKRVPKAELRGCGNVHSGRQGTPTLEAAHV